MDSLIKYKEIASKIVTLIANKASNLENFEAILSIDSARGQYLVMSDGWDGIERNYSTIVHIEVKKDAKVWLRIDATDLEIGKELINEGVLASDLVLAFHSPQMRKYSNYSFS